MDNIVRMTIFANSLLLSINDIFYFEAGILQPIKGGVFIYLNSNSITTKVE